MCSLLGSKVLKLCLRSRANKLADSLEEVREQVNRERTEKGEEG